EGPVRQRPGDHPHRHQGFLRRPSMSESRFQSRGQRGFTLVEDTVSPIVTFVVLLGVLALFDFSNRLTRVQTNISDMQQSLPVAQPDSVRLIRMAGRGGLPVGNPPTGMAVTV